MRVSQTGFVFGLFTGFAFTVMAVAALFVTTFSPLGWVALALAIVLGIFMVQLMLRI